MAGSDISRGIDRRREQPRIVFYGSLMRGFNTQQKLRIAGKLRYIGPCSFAGTLYDLGRYPGAVPGAGLVFGELFAVKDTSVLQCLDAFEDCYAEQPRRSLYSRERIVLASPGVPAWVYWYQRPVRGKSIVPSGDWYQHMQLRS